MIKIHATKAKTETFWTVLETSKSFNTCSRPNYYYLKAYSDVKYTFIII